MDRVLVVFPTAWDVRNLTRADRPLADDVELVFAEPSDADCPYDLDILRFIDETLGAQFDVVDIPAELKDEAEAARHQLVELAVEQDDAALEAYLGGEEPDAEMLKRCIRKGTVSGAFVPVLCGSAFKNKGVQPLLDAVVDYLPAPTDVAAIHGVKMGTDDDVVRHASDDEPFSGLAFKIMSDPFVGSLTFVRIYSGVLTAGCQPFPPPDPPLRGFAPDVALASVVLCVSSAAFPSGGVR